MRTRHISLSPPDRPPNGCRRICPNSAGRNELSPNFGHLALPPIAAQTISPNEPNLPGNPKNAAPPAWVSETDTTRQRNPSEPNSRPCALIRHRFLKSSGARGDLLSSLPRGSFY